MSSTGLEMDGVIAGYGDLTVLHGLSLRVAGGEIVLVTGPNGAGKTTLVSCVAGTLRPRRGSIRLDGRELLGLPTGERTRRGVGLVPEGGGLFGSLTVRENLRVAARAARIDRRQRAAGIAAAVAAFPIIGERLGQPVRTLSGGEQQMVAIGRALLASPRVLLLDEPSIGLAPLVWRRVLDTLRHLADEGRIVVLVEQRMLGALGSADRCVVIQQGRLVRDLPAAEVEESGELVGDWLARTEAS